MSGVPSVRMSRRAALTVRRQNKPDGAAHPRVGHLPQRVGQERMPVAHPHIDRQRRARVLEALPQPGSLEEGALGDWRNAAKERVMLSNFLDASRWNTSAAQHVGKERADVIRALRPAKADQQHSVERGPGWSRDRHNSR